MFLWWKLITLFVTFGLYTIPHVAIFGCSFLCLERRETLWSCPVISSSFFVAFSLYGMSVSGAVFSFYVEDPELPLNYRGGPDDG